MLQDGTEGLCAVPIQMTVSDVKELDESVGFKDRHQNHEIFASDVVFADVEMSDTIGALEREGQVFQSKAVVEEPIEVALLDSLLVLELHF